MRVLEEEGKNKEEVIKRREFRKNLIERRNKYSELIKII